MSEAGRKRCGLARWAGFILSSVVALAGCAPEETKPAYLGAGGASSQTHSAATEACEEGLMRPCTVTVPQANGVKSCWQGVQFCVEGTWSRCGDGSIVEANATPKPSESEFDSEPVP